MAQLFHHNSSVMVGVFATSVVYRGFEPLSVQTKDYIIGIYCFSAKDAALRSKSEDWLARNQNNVSEWSDMSSCGWTVGSVSWHYKDIIKHAGLVQSGHHHFIECNLSSP